VYALDSPPGARLVLSQQPPRRRIDIQEPGEAPPESRSLFAGPDGSTDCTRDAVGWMCSSSREGDDPFSPLAAGDVTRTVDQLKASRDTYTFRVISRTVADVRASCLVTDPRPDKAPASATRGLLCISHEGVPLLVEGGATPLRATS